LLQLHLTPVQGIRLKPVYTREDLEQLEGVSDEVGRQQQGKREAVVQLKLTGWKELLRGAAQQLAGSNSRDSQRYTRHPVPPHPMSALLASTSACSAAAGCVCCAAAWCVPLHPWALCHHVHSKALDHTTVRRVLNSRRVQRFLQGSLG
jgi:hypothetical protein